MITLEEAKGIVSAAEHKAQQMGLPMNIAVMDAGRNLVAFHRLTPAASARDQRQCGTSRRKSGVGWRSNWMGERVELSGKVALVTGSSRGIGREIARELAKKGARVAVHYRTDREAAQETLASL